MSQKELAIDIGIRPPTISAISNNSVKHIPLDVLKKICIKLNYQPRYIVEHIAEATI